MNSNWSGAMPGRIQRRIVPKKGAVCCEENASVDITKMKPAQAIAGHHAQNKASHLGVGVLARSSDQFGEGRGLRQGSCVVTRIWLASFCCYALFGFVRTGETERFFASLRMTDQLSATPCGNSALP